MSCELDKSVERKPKRRIVEDLSSDNSYYLSTLIFHFFFVMALKILCHYYKRWMVLSVHVWKMWLETTEDQCCGNISIIWLLENAIMVLSWSIVMGTKNPDQIYCVKKCLYSELFWSAASRIRTEYGEIRNVEYRHFSHSDHSKSLKITQK